MIYERHVVVADAAMELVAACSGAFGSSVSLPIMRPPGDEFGAVECNGGMASLRYLSSQMRHLRSVVL